MAHQESLSVLNKGENNQLAKVLNDPTKPLNYKAPTKQKKARIKRALPRLQSILFTGDSKQAIMNDRLYKKGEKVKGYTVVSIEKESVILKYKNKHYTVKLYKQNNFVIN